MEGIRAGRFTASTAFRQLRVGSLDLHRVDIRQSVASHLARALEASRAAVRIIRRLRPALVVLVDKGYTPQGQLFDAALAEGIPAITWNAAHRGSQLILKRYTFDLTDLLYQGHCYSTGPSSIARA